MKAILANQKKKITGAASSIEEANLAAGMVLVSDSEGKVAASSITTTELGYLEGVDANIQDYMHAANDNALEALQNAQIAQNAAEEAASDAADALTTADAALPLAGGTMTGSLILKGDPTEDLEAATKQYVDNQVGQGFKWGNWTDEADATWWAELQDWILNNSTATERAACVGKTKSITLTTELCGTTTHLVRCIGADQDGSKTLTFQTKNCLSTTKIFDDSSAAWIGSTARYYCRNYARYFPGKSYLKTVSKGTCASTSDSRAGTVTYNNETGWLPSEREMGLDSWSPISVTNSTTSNAECTNGYNAAYLYYDSDNNRIKYAGDSGSSAVSYWERSRWCYSNGSNYVAYVGSSGGADGGAIYSDDEKYLAPAFVIG